MMQYLSHSNRVDADAVMLHLFATTDLEKTYRVNINLINLNQRPKVMGLVELLNEWLVFRIDVVRRRLQHRYDIPLSELTANNEWVKCLCVLPQGHALIAGAPANKLVVVKHRLYSGLMKYFSYSLMPFQLYFHK